MKILTKAYIKSLIIETNLRASSLGDGKYKFYYTSEGYYITTNSETKQVIVRKRIDKFTQKQIYSFYDND